MLTPRLAFRPLVLGIVLVGFGTAACSSSADEGGPISPSERAAEIPEGAAEISYSVLPEATTAISAITDRRRLVIRDEGAWQSFWDDFAALVQPKPAAPGVDFGSQMVIAATMGQRTSGGYGISVEEVAEKDGALYAAVRETSPGATCITPAVMTAPAVAVIVPRHEGPVAFVDTEVTHACGP